MCTHGVVTVLKIPRPEAGESDATPGVGFIYVNFAAPEDALVAYKAMTGRQFGGKVVLASFYDEGRYAKNDLS